MDVRILGPLEVGGRRDQLGPPKQRAVLAVLIVHVNEIVPTDRIIELVWGDDAPRTAGHSIQMYVSELRRILDPVARGVITTRPPGYVFEADPESIDSNRFRRLVNEGTGKLNEGNPDRGAECLRSALQLWRGSPLSDFAYEEFAQPEIRKLTGLRLTALQELAALELALGRSQPALALIETVIAEDPLRERPRELRMTALYRAGRQAEALREYQTFRAALAEELGLDPSPVLQQLQRRILAHDVSLGREADVSFSDAAISAPRTARVPSREASPSVVRESRKVVTVLFCDVTGSTALGEMLDPETLRKVMSKYFTEMRSVLERHGGTVEKFIGDAVMAVFGIPQSHEDDALRAVRSADEMRVALSALNKELRRDHGVALQARMGVNTGEVVAGDPGAGQAMVTGDVVNAAARLEQVADPGDILIGERTYELVRDAVETEPVEPLKVKGKSAAIPAKRLLAVMTGAPGVSRRLESPIVGRRRHLDLLHQTFERTQIGQTCHLFTLLGAPGVGKSRLEQEFVREIGDRATVLRGRCLSYGEGITYFPVIEVVKQAAGLGDFDPPDVVDAKISALLEHDAQRDLVSERLAQLLGLSELAMPDETFWAIRRVFEAVAHSHPLLLVFDDIHWGEPTFLDLVEHVAEWSRDAPILVLCLARPDLLDVRPTWSGGKWNATTAALEPLGDDECLALMTNLLGGAPTDASVSERIVSASEGNPLFVEELLRMLIDDGDLVPSDGGWVLARDLSSINVPPTIRAILAARLDKLPAPERAVAERASVVGKVFFLGAVEELTPAAERSGVQAALMSLVRRDFVRPTATTFADEDAFGFRHQLIRDAAYEGLPKELRAALHEGVADWIERVAGDRVEEQEEIVGYHLEQAFHYLESLGPVGSSGIEVARRAASHLGAAGQRAFGRGDTAAGRLFHRATSMLPTKDAARLSLLPEAVIAFTENGEFDAAARLIEEAILIAEEVGDPGALARARVAQADLLALTDQEEGATSLGRGVADEVIPVFERLEDELGLARAWRLRSTHAWDLQRWADMQADLERGLHHARRAGSTWDEQDILGMLSVAITFGPIPAPEALRKLDAVLDAGLGFRKAVLIPGKGVLLAMVGRIEEARRVLADAREESEDLGRSVWAASVRMASATAEHIVGDLGRAELELRAARDVFVRLGEKSLLSSVSGHLANVLCDLGRFEEALPFVEESRRLCSSTDLDCQILWRCALALVLGQRGDAAEADRFASEAVAMCRQTDNLNQRADMLCVLADVKLATGHHDEAIITLREAIDLYERKGNIVSAERTRARLDEPTT